MLEYAGSNENSDFKYVMFDLSTIYAGALYTYRDMIENEMVNFKLKTIIERYLLEDISPDTTFESHFYYMQPGDFAYKVYEQLRTKVRVNVPVQSKGFGGKDSVHYKEKVIKLSELAALTPAEKQAQGILIREIQISKLGLMTFTV